MPSRGLTRRERQFVAASGYAASLASLSTQRGRDQVGRFVRGAHSVARNIGRIFRDRQASFAQRRLDAELVDTPMPDAPTSVRAANLRGSVTEQVNSGRQSSVAPTSIDSSVVRNAVCTEPVIGSQLTLSEGNNIYRGLSMKLGGQMRAKDSIQNMLAHLSGHGSVVTEFSGYLESKANLRNGTFMCFRHNMGINGWLPNDPTVPNPPQAWPADLQVLFPISAKNNSSGLPDAWPGTPANVNAASPFIKHGGMDSWFAPLNVSDYENMSWNLNRLKLATSNPAVTGAGSNTGNVLDAPLYEKDAHGCFSSIYMNNIAGSFASDQPNKAFDAPYKYNMVFNDGRVSYNFMNKGDGPLTATIVVYKLKRGSVCSNNFKDYWTSGSLYEGGFFGQMKGPIEAGVTNAKLDAIGTDNLEGQTFNADDYHLNPDKPFMPITKWTKKGTLPVKEVQRMSFALPSGGRRELCIKLGGDIYDPANEPFSLGTGGPGPSGSQAGVAVGPQTRALVTDSTYVVLISTHGAKCTRAWSQTGGNFGRMGDMYAPSMLQWDARYTENIGACAYKKPYSRNIQVHGQRGSTFGTSGEMVSGGFPQAILPQQDAVRTATGGTPATPGTGASPGIAASMGSGHS